MPKTKPIPDGHHTITPYLVVRDALNAMAFYQQAFGAREVMRKLCPQTGRLMHGELRIGDSLLFLHDEFPEMGGHNAPQSLGGTSVAIHLYVENTDAVYNQAVKAGAEGTMPPADMFWGDRFAKLKDPFGHEWCIATHLEDLTPEEMDRRGQAFFAQMAKENAAACKS
jgi:PhnB protein